jgi:hypothetical protein
MDKKNNLIKSLNVAIRALETDSTNYKWQTHTQCNCGVVSQAVLGLSVDDLEDKIFRSKLFAHKNFDSKDDGGRGREKTWKNAVQTWCPIANKPLKTIFTELGEAGLSPEDICHLEFMENKAILAKSGIELAHTVTKQIEVGRQYVPSTTFWGKLFRKKVSVPVYETKTETDLDIDYYSKKENLIKYLKAWVKILKEEREPIEDDLSNYHINELNERLLVAVADEDYVSAAMLRDAISQYV